MLRGDKYENNQTETNNMMRTNKIITTISRCALGVCLAAGLATASKADIVVEFQWVQGVPSDATLFFGNALLNPNITSSGDLFYDETTSAISRYTFTVNGAVTITDDTVTPPNPDGLIILPSGNLHLSPVQPGYGNVASSDSLTSTTDGNWIDDASYDAANQNYFQTASGAAITGDWVAVPESNTVIAGALLLLPFGASAMRILRNKKQVIA